MAQQQSGEFKSHFEQALDRECARPVAHCPGGLLCDGYDAQDGRRYCCYCGRHLRALVKAPGATA